MKKYNRTLLPISSPGNNDMENAVRYYRLSMTERMYFEKFCPTDLVVPLNNLAMPLLGQGKPGKII